jgi:hypothetical protein
VTRFAAALLAVAALAVLAALATFALAPPAIAPLAVSSALLASVALALTIRSTLIDRADLRADVKNGYFGISDNVIVEVRLYNSGTRPIKVEEMGFAITKSAPMRPYIHWFKWSNDKTPELPVSLGESDSAKVWTWPVSIATWLLKLSPPAWLWVKDHAGRLYWFRLPADIVEAVSNEWPKAQDQVAKAHADVAAKMSKGGPADDEYGQPIKVPESAA